MLFGGSNRQQDYGVIYGFLSELFWRLSKCGSTQYFGHNVPHHTSGSEHRRPASSNTHDVVIHKTATSFIIVRPATMLMASITGGNFRRPQCHEVAALGRLATGRRVRRGSRFDPGRRGPMSVRGHSRPKWSCPHHVRCTPVSDRTADIAGGRGPRQKPTDKSNDLS